MSKLFQLGDVRNRPRRSGFDLQKKNAFTAKVGELLPCYVRMCYPGDKFTLRHQHFTRTMPVNTAAFTRIREYFDWYFVPLRLLNKNIAPALVQMQNNPVQASGVMANKVVTTDIPYTNMGGSGSAPGLYSLFANANLRTSENLDFFGFNRLSSSVKLLQYLRYGNCFYPSGSAENATFGLTSDTTFSLVANFSQAVNLLPLLAYQKIYCDFFRFEQWEKNQPYTYNADYYTGGDFFASLNTISSQQEYMLGNNVFTLRYANWNRDMFMGVMPNSQFGSVATIPVDSATNRGYVYAGSFSSSNAAYTDETGTGVANSSGSTLSPSAPLSVPLSTLELSFDVLQLRMAEALQRWKEVTQVSDQNYRDQIKAHFGVTLSPALSDSCIYIGGSASNIDISEVVNQSLSTDSDIADIKGKGVGTSQGSERFSCSEHGILMCIYHAVPLLDYEVTGQWQEWLYTTTEDLPVPEFDSIGMQTQSLYNLCNHEKALVAALVGRNAQTLGYVPRFVELKTDVDEIQGAFRTTLKSWVAPLSPTYLETWLKNSLAAVGSNIQLNYAWFKVNPHILDSIFVNEVDSTWDTDQLLVNAYIDVKAVRNFDYDGMPY